MKKVLISLLALLVVTVALVAAGCGEKQEVSTTSTTPSSSTTNPVSTEPDTRAISTPEEVVTAYLDALANDQYEDAESYWTRADVDDMVVSTNQIDTVIEVGGDVLDDRWEGHALVSYTQCESGLSETATLKFTLVKENGLWRISSTTPL